MYLSKALACAILRVLINERIFMNEINKVLVKSYIAQAMLTFALERLKDTNITTDKIAEEYANKIIEELK